MILSIYIDDFQNEPFQSSVADMGGGLQWVQVESLLKEHLSVN